MKFMKTAKPGLTNGILLLVADMKKAVHALAPTAVFVALALGLAPLIAFALARGGTLWPDAYAWRITWFTIMQATFSTVLSIGLAIPVSRAFARQKFWGRDALLAVFAVPLSLPVIVAVFGLAAVYGNAGVLPGVVKLYGVQGIVLAHVFFNLPLAVRLLLDALQSAAPESHRLSAQLGFDGRAAWQHVDWPALRNALPGVAALVFLLCAASFVVVLSFGGPAATTLEVAIFQSLRMDFDVSRTLTLSSIQILLSLVLVCAASRTLIVQQPVSTLRLRHDRFDGQNIISKCSDASWIGLAVLVVLPPLLAVSIFGLGSVAFSVTLLRALLTSTAIAAVSCLIAVPLAWGFAIALVRAPYWRGVIHTLGLGGFLIPPAVLATGWFLAFRTVDGGILLSIVLIAALNCLMSLPFLLSVLGPAVQRAIPSNDRLCAQLNLNGFTRLVLIDTPLCRSALAQGAVMTFVLSLGDLTAVTLLGSQGLLTMPSLVQQQMGHYQSHAAGGTAFILALLCLVMTLASQRLARWA